MSGLVLELQQEALNEASSTSALLRKALVVSKKLGVHDFAEWAQWELNGYYDDAVLPLYRYINVSLMARMPYHGWQEVLIPATIKQTVCAPLLFRQSVSVTEDLISSNKSSISLSVPLPLELHKRVMKATGSGSGVEFAFHFSPSALAGILHGARNTVLNWALKLEELGIRGEGFSFSPKDREVAATLTTVINYHGDVGQSQVMHHSPGSSQTITAGQFDHASLTRLIAELKTKKEEFNLTEDDNAELNAEIATVEAQLSSPSPKSKIIQESLGTIKRIAEGAMGGAVGNILTELARLLV